VKKEELFTLLGNIRPEYVWDAQAQPGRRTYRRRIAVVMAVCAAAVLVLVLLPRGGTEPQITVLPELIYNIPESESSLLLDIEGASLSGLDADDREEAKAVFSAAVGVDYGTLKDSIPDALSVKEVYAHLYPNVDAPAWRRVRDYVLVLADADGNETQIYLCVGAKPMVSCTVLHDYPTPTAIIGNAVYVYSTLRGTQAEAVLGDLYLTVTSRTIGEEELAELLYALISVLS